MTVNHFSVTSATTLSLDVTPMTPICATCGNYSDLALDLMREMLGDIYAKTSPDMYDDGRFVIHADIDMDGHNYKICYIRNADFIGDNRIAVNFKPSSVEFSLDDTKEYMDRVQMKNLDSDNIFYKSASIRKSNLSESQQVLTDFKEWIENCVCSSKDTRPLFIYDAFDYFDMSVDTSEIFDFLSDLGRQVFIALNKNYPNKNLLHNKVTVINTDTYKI